MHYALKTLPAELANDVIVPWLMLGCSKSLQDAIQETNNSDWGNTDHHSSELVCLQKNIYQTTILFVWF